MSYLVVLTIVMFAVQGTLAQLEGTTVVENKRIQRVSEMKCDEYYRNIFGLLGLPVPQTTDQLLFNTFPPSVTTPATIRKRQAPSSDCKEPNSDEFDLPYPPPGIIGGQTTTVGEFPHMVAIGWSQPGGGFRFSCGGALISPRYVLTAAHCTYAHGEADPYPSVVRLGDQNIDSSVDDGAQPVEVSIKTILNHPEYTRRKNYNDIAILELEEDVNFTTRIQPACLWPREHLGSYTEAIATGWGVINSETRETAKDLQKVTLKILDNEYCNKTLSIIINRKWDRGFDSSQLCAGEPEGGKDTCQGDSGSPLQVLTTETPPRYFVVAITSFGPTTCARLPAVYSRVSSHMDWIEHVVWPEEFKKISSLQSN